MACGNAMRAIRALRLPLQNDLDDQHMSHTEENFNASERQDGSGTSAAEVTSDPQIHASTKPVEETKAESEPSTSKSVTSTVSTMTNEALLEAFPWLRVQSSSEDEPDEEGVDDDDDDIFTPAQRCVCEDLNKIV
eukprot:TRINITY_DN8527_c0_g1_i1.p1 TRINITY_DN8527_c0_g1~~TRINITY_DN8527_c0_g1_i1.p1  ORF type:complete len:155 (+),score=34.06 TRINITY_DN8527_c0_g1_i1:62-466(+)